MCYSAQVQADYKKYVVMFGATMSIRDFYEIFYRRGLDPKIKIPKAVEASFGDPQSDDECAIKALIDDFNDKQATKFEEELFKQRKRLADAERILQTKPTKKAQDDQRIATDKVKQLMGRHADLKRTELRNRDSRIFPGWSVPVMIWEDDERVIKPMRYACTQRILAETASDTPLEAVTLSHPSSRRAGAALTSRRPTRFAWSIESGLS